jgi:hypothetical protein
VKSALESPEAGNRDCEEVAPRLILHRPLATSQCGLKESVSGTGAQVYRRVHQNRPASEGNVVLPTRTARRLRSSLMLEEGAVVALKAKRKQRAVWFVERTREPRFGLVAT